jgi:hypothetical protein
MGSNHRSPSHLGQIKERSNDIVLCIKTHPSNPTTSTQHEEQRAGQDDCPRYAHSRQTRTLRPDARRDVRTHRPSLSKRLRGHEDLRHTVRARNVHAPVFIRHNLGAGEDIHELLVRMEDRVHFPGYAPRALASYVREEREYRRFGDCHGLVLYCHQLHLRGSKVRKCLGATGSGRTGVVRKAGEYSIASFRAAFINLMCWTSGFSC